jgi:hypothetical protein
VVDFRFAGSLVAAASGAGLVVAFGNGGASVRRIELQDRIIEEIPTFTFGASQIEVLDWLADEDPAILDFETTPFRTILERYAIVTLYNSLNGRRWQDQRRFLSKESVCKWNIINAAETTIKDVGCNEQDEFVVEINLSESQLNGKIPSEINCLSN